MVMLDYLLLLFHVSRLLPYQFVPEINRFASFCRREVIIVKETIDFFYDRVTTTTTLIKRKG